MSNDLILPAGVKGCPLCHAKPSLLQKRAAYFEISCPLHEQACQVMASGQTVDEAVSSWNDDYDWTKIGGIADLVYSRPIFGLT